MEAETQVFRFKIDDSPCELHRGQDEPFYILNTESGEMKCYSSFQEAFVTYFEKIENAILKRGFRPEDFVIVEAEQNDEEIPQEEAGALRDDNIDGFKQRFENIKKAAYAGKEVDYNTNEEIHAYFALVDIYNAYRKKILDADNATRLVKKVKTNLLTEIKERKQLRDMLYRNSENIKRSSEILRYVMTQVGKAPLTELLVACVEYICRLNGDTVTSQVLKRRLENANKKTDCDVQ
jgi:hypothetical protein